MNKTRTTTPPSQLRYPTRLPGDELRRVIRAIQELTLELDQLRGQEPSTPELEAKQHRLEHLRWRLATLARQTATDHLGNAA